MRVVIQCAGVKIATAGSLRDHRSATLGNRLCFVAHPEQPSQVRPDDPVAPGSGFTWRDRLVEYNDGVEATHNPDGLELAGDLYEPKAYGILMEAFGYDNVYIMSAGWGLVRASYWLPCYDITFSAAKDVPPHARRRMTEDGWKDFNHLLEDWQEGEIGSREEVHFFGGQSYLPLYVELARGLPCPKIVHQKSATPDIEGFTIRRYTGRTSTNWHYAAVSEFLRRVFP